MLAKHALSQLSYGPILRQRRPSRQLGVAFAPSKVCDFAGAMTSNFGAKRREAERPPRLTAR
jgi:hypothetical protein